jgi:hypothetical protein
MYICIRDAAKVMVIMAIMEKARKTRASIIWLMVEVVAGL